MSLTNVYHLRRVADTSAKACLVCYKPSTSVLITPDNKFYAANLLVYTYGHSLSSQDFFYVCPAHLQDRHFCSPIVDTESDVKRLKEDEMAKEIEKVKKEYEEKQQRKKDREKQFAKDEKDKKDKDDKDDSKDKDGKNESKSKDNDEKERDDKIDAIKKDNPQSKPDSSARIFALHKTFYQMRVDRLRGIERAKRNQERMRNPSLFPSVPNREL
ncbi:uncharacterized protein N7459_009345 [Penicillium hispanicum]|uniref:uncharacterized protein n=1 Tax=Penicillium hispanicum TaxID=1080232 RepID=UPI002541148E|nr:uncharacterized protein N7459_009345 [Penicillium hispanicum]KAJ5569915.1 hypothetical protein N7459_009345 [Penicillium hispanicum]